jgi:hypothetical protein
VSTKKQTIAKAKAAAKKAITAKTSFREGSQKQKAFDAYKAEYAKQEDKGKWREALAKKLSLSPATIASWCGGQFRKAVTK